ncbi:Proteasome subunit beta type-3 [Pteropus alecto]|uniref:Proteasome subunit beta type-3 n=1 Tax=Pteropus alecto TaxID=9402 RepID=L5JQD7_PTEAL|nr:Proteasome subunit beta type-3 [Pteropus alecto]
MSVVAKFLYEKCFGPYYTEPVICGLDPKSFKPFICSLDLIGCPMVTDNFVVRGTYTKQKYMMCKSIWEISMDPEHLFEAISQVMPNAMDQDVESGMGVIVHISEEDKITTKILKARMDYPSVPRAHLKKNIFSLPKKVKK